METKKRTKKKTTSKRRREAKAIHAADQENTRLRDERKKAKDGMTASERAMAGSRKKKKKKKKKKTGSKKTRTKNGRGRKSSRTSVLDAAAEVLGGAKEPMGCKRIVEVMSERKLWTTDGKTPAATLYSAIFREIQSKGKQARFEKVERGRFRLRKGAR